MKGKHEPIVRPFLNSVFASECLYFAFVVENHVWIGVFPHCVVVPYHYIVIRYYYRWLTEQICGFCIRHTNSESIHSDLCQCWDKPTEDKYKHRKYDNTTDDACQNCPCSLHVLISVGRTSAFTVAPLVARKVQRLVRRFLWVDSNYNPVVVFYPVVSSPHLQIKINIYRRDHANDCFSARNAE